VSRGNSTLVTEATNDWPKSSDVKLDKQLAIQRVECGWITDRDEVLGPHPLSTSGVVGECVR
jgi:hypothetical protein